MGARRQVKDLWNRSRVNVQAARANRHAYSAKTRVKRNVESYAAWFDSVHQYHGPESTRGPSFSIRVAGTFSDELRAQIPVPTKTRASTPSLWARQERALAHE